MSSDFISTFQSDAKLLKSFAAELEQYNVILECAYITMIKEIANNSMGKTINKVFCNRINAVIDPSDAVTEIRTSDYSSDKIVTIKVTNSNFKHRYDIPGFLIHCVTFSNSDKYGNISASIGYKFIEGSIKEIEKIININRERVALYKDAAKNAKKYAKAFQKCVEDFIAKMESINPIFVDGSVTSNMYYYGMKHYNYEKNRNEIVKDVERYSYQKD